jgi:hypothetical protein
MWMPHRAPHWLLQGLMGRVFNVLPSLGCALVDRGQSVCSPLVQACVNIVGVSWLLVWTWVFAGKRCSDLKSQITTDSWLINWKYNLCSRFQTTLEIGKLCNTRSYSKSTPYFVLKLKYYIMVWNHTCCPHSLTIRSLPTVCFLILPVCSPPISLNHLLKILMVSKVG